MLTKDLPYVSAVIGGLTGLIAGGFAWLHRTRKIVEGLRSERRELADANARLAHAATHDYLTGLLNRQGIMALLDTVAEDR
ncbi:MAG: hypothetical protein ACKO84_07320, partial [Actinomycetota bacterium]